MRGDPTVIEYLNKGLRNELAAVNQYWLHYRSSTIGGYKALAKKSREESMEEMRHADSSPCALSFSMACRICRCSIPSISARP